MNRRMTICQRLTGDVRTEKRTKNAGGKEWIVKNNTLNIKLIYAYIFLRICSASSAAIVKRQSFDKIEISLYYQEERNMQLCSYAVMQFFLRGVKRDERNFII